MKEPNPLASLPSSKKITENLCLYLVKILFYKQISENFKVIEIIHYISIKFLKDIQDEGTYKYARRYLFALLQEKLSTKIQGLFSSPAHRPIIVPSDQIKVQPESYDINWNQHFNSKCDFQS